MPSLTRIALTLIGLVFFAVLAYDGYLIIVYAQSTDGNTSVFRGTVIGALVLIGSLVGILYLLARLKKP